METKKGNLVRSNTDPNFWDFVDKAGDKWLCTFCGHKFAVGTSISRIKWHLSREKRRGTAICKKVPDDIQEAAYMAIHGSRKMPKTMQIRSNAAGVSSGTPVPPCEHINNVKYLASNGGSLSMEVQSVEQEPGVGIACFSTDVEDEINLWVNCTSSEGNEMQNIDREGSALDGFVTGYPARDGESVPVDTQGVELGEREGRACSGTEMEVMNEMLCGLFHEPDLVDQETLNCWPQIGLQTYDDVESSEKQNNNGEGDDSVSGGEQLLTTRLVGRVFEENLDEILSCIENDEILNVGVYGMGGVGKTTLMMHAHNQLQKRSNLFRCMWITVSQHFNITEVQDLIANAIGLDLSNQIDKKKRAANLSKALNSEQKRVIILDDLWNDFRLEDVGIPVGCKRCKLVITTRSLEVCRKMGCHKKIEVTPLSEEDAWSLFEEKLGNKMKLPADIQQIAKSIVKQCAGLPLGIMAMAGSMREVEDVREWRNALVELKGSKNRLDDMEPEVFQVLKLSYNHLRDFALHQSLLYCALYPEDCLIVREELIGYLIDEGIIEEMESRQQEFDKGHTMLNKLVNVCLLEPSSTGRIKMHDLIRDMALQIQRDGSGVMIKAGTQLIEFPREKYWTKDLTRVSLVKNHFKEIPSSHSPRCPTLSTLLLCRNLWLKSIGDSFFQKLHALKILDVSHTFIEEVPNAVSNLVGLTTLLLHDCKRLRYVPSLAKLTRLKKLDVSNTILEKVPRGMRSLQNLKHLDMYDCGIDLLPDGLLPKLHYLQFLRFDWPTSEARIIRKELECLRKLEMLTCRFRDIYQYKNLMANLPLSCYRLKCPLSCCRLVINRSIEEGLPKFERSLDWVACGIGEKTSLVELPVDIQDIRIHGTINRRSLCQVFSLENVKELKCLLIRSSNKIEYLLLFFVPSLFDILERLHLHCLDNFRALFGGEETAPRLPPFNGTFSHLTSFQISECHRIKWLFTSSLIHNLKNLEEMVIHSCRQLKVIIEMEGEMISSAVTTNTTFNLPKLLLLKLSDLEALKSIFDGALVCSSLREIKIIRCPKLRSVPLCFPLPSLKSIKVYPEEWWDSVEWGDPSNKNVLRPKCLFESN